MTDSQRQSRDNFIAEALPELYSSFVRADDKQLPEQESAIEGNLL
jgi:hypothetical protein